MLYKSTLRIFLAAVSALAISTASAVNADYYSGSSLLANGRWVKIKVSESGIQQITHEQLRQWGFDDPSAVTVFGYGGVAGVTEVMDATMPDDLPQQLVEYRPDRLLFYGESNCRVNAVYTATKTYGQPISPDVERNNVADAGYYFITDSQPVLTKKEIPYIYNNMITPRRYHWEISYYEEEDNNPMRFSQLYFGPDFSQSGEPLTFSFPVENLYRENTASNYVNTAFLNILVGSGTAPNFQVTYPHRNDKVTVDMRFDSSTSHNVVSTNANTTNASLVPQLLPTATSFDVTINLAPNAKCTYAAVERLVFAYPQKNDIGDRNAMLLCDNDISAGQSIEIGDTDYNLLVWNVDNAYNVRPYDIRFSSSQRTYTFTNDKTYKISGYGDRGLRIIAFNPTKDQLPVEYAGEVTNQNLHALDVPDFVILTADAFVAQAERLAQIHREELGQDVIVLRQGEIFNEFSSGTPSLWGIRRAMKMFYDRNPDKFKHLLLFGASSYDNRGLTTSAAAFRDRGALLLNYGTPYYQTMGKVTTAYSCDGYFGMLSDTPPEDELIHSIQHINVGRLPVSDEMQARSAVDKVNEYLTYSPTSDIYQRVLLVADYGDGLSHMTSAEKTATSFLNNYPGMTLVKAYSSLYPANGRQAQNVSNVIQESLKRGVLYFNYTGHGKSDALGMQILYDLPAVHTTGYNYYPFAMIASCDTYEFDRMSQSIAQEMVFQSKGGMIGVVGACREVYQSRNEVLSETMADVFSKSKPGTMTGDILRKARNEMLIDKWPSEKGLMINTACYNLCGDPALPLFLSSNDIVIESVNSQSYVKEDGAHTVNPLATNTISGYVADDDDTGTVASDFNGNVILTLYESPTQRKVVNKAANGEPDQAVDTDENLIIEVTGKVVDGRFDISFIPPMPMRKGAYNRATITAVLPDNSKVATTYTTSLRIDTDDMPGTPADTSAPEITSLYIDSPSFVSGDVTAQDFVAYATVVEAESGIYGSSGTVGPNCRFVLDESKTYPVVGTQFTNDGAGTYNIVYNFSSLSDGHHTLTLYISDNAGNSATKSVDFFINNNAANPSLTVAETPARVQATIDMLHNFNGAPTGKLIVEDEQGNTVFTRANVSFPFEWDLTDGNGNLVADGVYRAYAICRGGTLYGSTPKVDIVVVQKKWYDE